MIEISHVYLDDILEVEFIHEPEYDKELNRYIGGVNLRIGQESYTIGFLKEKYNDQWSMKDQTIYSSLETYTYNSFEDYEKFMKLKELILNHPKLRLKFLLPMEGV